MSATEHDARETVPEEELPELWMFVEETHYHFYGGLPYGWPPPWLFTTHTPPDDNGNGSTHAPPAPFYPPSYLYPRRSSGSGIVGPSDGAWQWLLYGILATLAVFGLLALGQWIFGGSDSTKPAAPAFNRTVTVNSFIAARHFRLSNHSVCNIEKGGNGALVLSMNRGGGCHQTIKVLVPAGKYHPVRANRNTATFNENRRVLFRDNRADSIFDADSPNSGGKAGAVAAMRKLSLSEMVTQNLRDITLRLKPAQYKLYK